MKRLRIKDIHQDFIPDPISGTAAIIEEAINTQAKKVQTTRARRKKNPASTVTATPLLSPAITSLLPNNTNVNTSSLMTELNNDTTCEGPEDNSCESLDVRNLQIEIDEEDESQHQNTLDDNSVLGIKNYLRCQNIDWEDVKEMWSKTYMNRKEDIEHCTIKDVLQQWPKYLNARGMDLVGLV